MNTSRTVRLGIVGAGFIGQLAHIANYAQIPNCRIVALAAGRSELRRRVAEYYNIERTYPTHKELLEDKEVEAVVAVTARQNTGPVALDCLKAGKSLLTEKPMASTLEQAQRLVKVAISQKVTYTVGYMRRYDAGVQQAKLILGELIRSCELGSILYSKVHNYGGNAYCGCGEHIVTNEKKTTTWEAWEIAPHWIPEDLKHGYHQYLNMYCHNINLIRYLFDAFPKVSYVRFDKPSCAEAGLDLDTHRVLFEANSSSGNEWDENVEIYFSEGRLKITMPPPLLKNVTAKVEVYKKEDSPAYVPYLKPSWSFRRQAEAFIEDVLERRESLSSGADSLEDIRIIESIWKMRIEGQQKYSGSYEKKSFKCQSR